MARELRRQSALYFRRNNREEYERTVNEAWRINRQCYGKQTALQYFRLTFGDNVEKMLPCTEEL